MPLTATATPVISPPPPTGAMTTSTSGQCSRISTAVVPAPAITSSSLYGETYIAPVVFAYSSARRSESSYVSAMARRSAPWRAIASSFARGAWRGVKIVACRLAALGRPGDRHARDCRLTPSTTCGRLAPECRSTSRRSALSAPRTLNVLRHLSDSSFSRTVAAADRREPVRLDERRARRSAEAIRVGWRGCLAASPCVAMMIASSGAPAAFPAPPFDEERLPALVRRRAARPASSIRGRHASAYS